MRATSLAIALFVAGCGPNVTHPSATHDPYRGGNSTPLSCVPNLDGQIDANEMAPSFDAAENFLVSPANQQRSVDLVGRIDSQGHRVWDWSAPDSTDEVASLSASPIAGKWYASSFPTDAFVVPIDAAKTTDGIYLHTDSALSLLGVASAEQHPAGGETLMVYDAPVELYRFPLEPGAQWVSVGTVRNGLFRGLPYAGRDTYEVSVDASGDLVLPQLEFTQAMRVRMHVTLEPSVGSPVSYWQVSFVSECFGEVARATSLDGEEQENFTTAAEVRRLGF